MIEQALAVLDFEYAALGVQGGAGVPRRARARVAWGRASAFCPGTAGVEYLSSAGWEGGTMLHYLPRDIPRSEARTGWVALGVGQIDGAVEFGILLRGLAHQSRIEVGQHHLRAAEEAPCAGPIDGAPVEIEEPILALSVHQRSPAVDRPIARLDDPNVDAPGCARGVAAEQLDCRPAAADPDMDVLERTGTVGGRVAAGARQVAAVDLNDHADDSRRSPIGASA